MRAKGDFNKKSGKKIQVWAELLMSGICEDTLQCINYPKMTFKYSSSWHEKKKQNVFHVWKSKANQTEVWIQRSFEYLIKRNNWVKMPFFKSKRVNFPLIIYCWNRAWHLWSHGSKHLFSGRPIHCCWPDSCSPRTKTKKLALICPLTMIVFDVPQVPKAAVWVLPRLISKSVHPLSR